MKPTFVSYSTQQLQTIQKNLAFMVSTRMAPKDALDIFQHITTELLFLRQENQQLKQERGN